jgi:D-alanyl-D-alanine carboxypeptidase
VGDTLTLENFYYPLLLESSNDAAVAIAEHAGFARFINLMNRKALVLNMSSTRFRDPSGLADENTSSARDLLQLARYIHNKKPLIFDITTRQQELTEQPSSDALRNFTNNNPMVGRTDFLGGKNGYTDNARHTLLSVFQTEVAGEKRDVVIIVLSAESHVEDTLLLLSWLGRAF